MDLRGTHHGFYGLALLLIASWAALAVHVWPWRVVYVALALLGAWVAGDDVYQHIRQIGDPLYVSSLKRWWYRQAFSRWPVFLRLTTWLDELFGKRTQP